MQLGGIAACSLHLHMFDTIALQEAPARLAAAKSAPLLGHMHTIIEVASTLSRASSGVSGEVNYVHT